MAIRLVSRISKITYQIMQSEMTLRNEMMVSGQKSREEQRKGKDELR